MYVRVYIVYWRDRIVLLSLPLASTEGEAFCADGGDGGEVAAAAASSSFTKAAVRCTHKRANSFGHPMLSSSVTRGALCDHRPRRHTTPSLRVAAAHGSFRRQPLPILIAFSSSPYQLHPFELHPCLSF
uniref:Secreted protein n=1 Tax=Ascaris lumbricoides TaxID=6252 RepID=A0A0M3I0J9_ASCLU